MFDSPRYVVTYTAHDGAIATAVRIVWPGHAWALAHAEAHAEVLRKITSISDVTVEQTQ